MVVKTKEYRYTKPGRAVLDLKCLYWLVWVLWLLWSLRLTFMAKKFEFVQASQAGKYSKIFEKMFPPFFDSGRNPAWLAWSSGARVPTLPNIDT